MLSFAKDLLGSKDGQPAVDNDDKPQPQVEATEARLSQSVAVSAPKQCRSCIILNEKPVVCSGCCHLPVVHDISPDHSVPLCPLRPQTISRTQAVINELVAEWDSFMKTYQGMKSSFVALIRHVSTNRDPTFCLHFQPSFRLLIVCVWR